MYKGQRSYFKSQSLLLTCISQFNHEYIHFIVGLFVIFTIYFVIHCSKKIFFLLHVYDFMWGRKILYCLLKLSWILHAMYFKVNSACFWSLQAAKFVPDMSVIKAIQRIAWASSSSSLHLVHATNEEIHKALEKVSYLLME